MVFCYGSVEGNIDDDMEGLVEVSDYELKKTFRLKIRVLIASVIRQIVLYPWLEALLTSISE